MDADTPMSSGASGAFQFLDHARLETVSQGMLSNMAEVETAEAAPAGLSGAAGVMLRALEGDEVDAQEIAAEICEPSVKRLKRAEDPKDILREGFSAMLQMMVLSMAMTQRAQTNLQYALQICADKLTHIELRTMLQRFIESDYQRRETQEDTVLGTPKGLHLSGAQVAQKFLQFDGLVAIIFGRLALLIFLVVLVLLCGA